MKLKIRCGAFETNSSSEHAFVRIPPETFAEFRSKGWIDLSPETIGEDLWVDGWSDRNSLGSGENLSLEHRAKALSWDDIKEKIKENEEGLPAYYQGTTDYDEVVKVFSAIPHLPGWEHTAPELEEEFNRKGVEGQNRLGYLGIEEYEFEELPDGSAVLFLVLYRG